MKQVSLGVPPTDPSAWRQWATKALQEIERASNQFGFSLTGDVTTQVGGTKVPTTAGVRLQRSVTSSPIIIASNDRILNVNISSGFPTCTLPAASTLMGVALTFKDVGGQFGAHALTITPNGVETIDGAASLVLASNYQAVTLNPFNDGVNTGWFIT